MAHMDKAFLELVKTVTGEEPEVKGESFNLHYTTSQTFIKVTRPWVKPWRFQAEMGTAVSLSYELVPHVRPYSPEIHTYEDGNGETRWVTFWELVEPACEQYSDEEAMNLIPDWILFLHKIPAPPGAPQFQLGDFLHAIHVRLDGTEHPYRERIISRVEELSTREPYRHPHNDGFLHGDLHPGNLLRCKDGSTRLIDWELSCVGPMSWDAAQNVRFTPEAKREAQREWWLSQEGVTAEELDLYIEVRTLSMVAHLIAAKTDGAHYRNGLELLGWPYVEVDAHQ